MAAQSELFAPAATPSPVEGWEYQPDFINPAEEAELLDHIAALALHEPGYKNYSARRRIASFGSQYDFDANRLLPGPSLPEFLLPLRAKAAAWLQVPPESFSSALIAEYRPGTPLGWHRDVPDYETVVGVSLAGACRMRFRRYPPLQARKADVLAVVLEPRSAYVLQGIARWGWQHSIAPTPALRYSITFRSKRSA